MTACGVNVDVWRAAPYGELLDTHQGELELGLWLRAVLARPWSWSAPDIAAARLH